MPLRPPSDTAACCEDLGLDTRCSQWVHGQQVQGGTLLSHPVPRKPPSGRQRPVHACPTCSAEGLPPHWRAGSLSEGSR